MLNWKPNGWKVEYSRALAMYIKAGYFGAKTAEWWVLLMVISTVYPIRIIASIYLFIALTARPVFDSESAWYCALFITIWVLSEKTARVYLFIRLMLHRRGLIACPWIRIAEKQGA